MKRMIAIVSVLALGSALLAGRTERSDRVGEDAGRQTPSASPTSTTPPSSSEGTTAATPSSSGETQAGEAATTK